MSRTYPLNKHERAWKWWEATFIPMLLFVTATCLLGVPVLYTGVNHEVGMSGHIERRTVVNLLRGGPVPLPTRNAQLLASSWRIRVSVFLGVMALLLITAWRAPISVRILVYNSILFGNMIFLINLIAGIFVML
jgi:hypothetical protein